MHENTSLKRSNLVHVDHVLVDWHGQLRDPLPPPTCPHGLWMAPSAIISLLILQTTVLVNWDTLDRTVRMIVQLNATVLDDMLWHS